MQELLYFRVTAEGEHLKIFREKSVVWKISKDSEYYNIYSSNLSSVF